MSRGTEVPTRLQAPSEGSGQPVRFRTPGYNFFFKLNSDEHEICPANKTQITNNCKLLPNASSGRQRRL